MSPSDASRSAPARPLWRLVLGSIGPAIITASVVLGPGSILSASKVGYEHGYAMNWVLAAAALLMAAMTALSARLGVALDDTPCAELAKRAGRPVAVLAGGSLFLIVACFQFGNNLGVLAAFEPWLAPDPQAPTGQAWRWGAPLALVLLNGFIVAVLFGLKSVYGPLEKLMMLLVALMLVAFAGNLVLARPDVLAMLRGLLPSLPADPQLPADAGWLARAASLWPHWQAAPADASPGAPAGQVVDRLRPVIALIGTTFSVGGAFYQAYLVRQKGWTRETLRTGFVDTAVGIGVLTLLTLMILTTAAAVLHGRQDVGELNSAADVARQLEPAFGGAAARLLFCLGVFSAAFSSFLVNAMIGGSVLSDALGWGGALDRPAAKTLTTVALLLGMSVALYVSLTGQRPVNLIVFAQALTVLGVPVLAISLCWLATRPDLVGERRTPNLLRWLGYAAAAAATALALRVGYSLLLPLWALAGAD